MVWIWIPGFFLLLLPSFFRCIKLAQSINNGSFTHLAFAVILRWRGRSELVMRYHSMGFPILIYPSPANVLNCGNEVGVKKDAMPWILLFVGGDVHVVRLGNRCFFLGV